jgi:hypothetical protein
MMVIVWGYLSQQISQQIGKRLGGLILIFYSENQKKSKKSKKNQKKRLLFTSC